MTAAFEVGLGRRAGQTRGAGLDRLQRHGQLRRRAQSLIVTLQAPCAAAPHGREAEISHGHRVPAVAGGRFITGITLPIDGGASLGTPIPSQPDQRSQPFDGFHRRAANAGLKWHRMPFGATPRRPSPVMPLDRIERPVALTRA